MTEPNVNGELNAQEPILSTGITNELSDVLKHSFSAPLPSEKSKFEGLFQTSITRIPTKEEKAKHNSHAFKREFKPTEALIDPSAPGRRTILLNSVKPSMSAMADLIYDRPALEELVVALARYDLINDIFRKIFSVPHRRIRTNNILGSYPQYYDAVRSVMSKCSPRVQSFITCLLVLELEPLHISRPTEHLSFTIDRTVRFVGLDGLRKAVQADAIEFALMNYKPGVTVTDSKQEIEQSELIADISPRWISLSRALMDSSRLNKYVDDALYLVRAYNVANDSLCPAPESMMASEDLRRLSDNISIVLASFSKEIVNFRSPLHELNDAIRYFATTIARSKRLRVIRLTDLSDEIGHFSVKNKAQTPIFCTVYQNMVPESGRAHATQLQAIGKDDTFRAQSPQYSAEQMLNSMIDPILTHLTPAAAAEIQSELASAFVEQIKEEDEPIISKILVDDTALMIYSAHLAQRTMISIDMDERPVLLFSVSTSGLNYTGKGEFHDFIVTQLPEKVILLSKRSDTSTVQRAPIQTIPDDMRNSFLSAPTTDLFVSLNRKMMIKPLVGRTRYTTTIHLDRILGLDHIAGECYFSRAPISEACVNAFYSASLELAALIDSLYTPDDLYVHGPLMRDVMHTIGSRMHKVWTTPAMDSIVGDVIEDLASSDQIDPHDRRAIRSDIKYKHVRFFVATSAMHAIAIRLKLVDFDKAVALDSMLYDYATYHALSRTI